MNKPTPLPRPHVFGVIIEPFWICQSGGAFSLSPKNEKATCAGWVHTHKWLSQIHAKAWLKGNVHRTLPDNTFQKLNLK
jgi:hypothetical protein